MERLTFYLTLFSGVAMWFLIAYALYETAGTGVIK
jgi:hypothetical protein